jgi:phospholipid transport system substrate-binding protein
MRNKVLFSCSLALCLLVSQSLWASMAASAEAGSAGATSDPLGMVRDTADRVLAEVSAQKEALQESPQKIYPLVEEIVLPRFDFSRMSQLVLGRHWKAASDEQKGAFTKEFRELLVRTYATALLNYSGQQIHYKPFNAAPDANEVTVATEVANQGAPAIPINYSVYRGDHGWQVFDVTIDGVSLVSNYRSSFGKEVQRYQLDGLIQRLAERNASGKGE